jgi:hypothetical protein
MPGDPKPSLNAVEFAAAFAKVFAHAISRIGLECPIFVDDSVGTTYVVDSVTYEEDMAGAVVVRIHELPKSRHELPRDAQVISETWAEFIEDTGSCLRTGA